MTIDELISQAMTAPFPIATLEAVAQARGITPDAAATEFATGVAKGYLCGRISWPDADAAMNNLSAAFVNAGSYVTDLTYDIYIAFDEGEYTHSGDDSAMDGEPRTRALLADLASRFGA